MKVESVGSGKWKTESGGYGFAVGLSAIPLSLQPLTHSLSLVQLAVGSAVATIPSPRLSASVF